MKRKYKILLIILVVIFGFSIGFYVYTSRSNVEEIETQYDTSSDNYKAILSGFNGLKSLDTNYVITNTMELPNESMCYIEVNTSDGNYTEYPIDENGNYGTIQFNEAENTEYIIYDYLTKDNEVYILNGSYNSSDEENDYIWLHMPKSYAEDISSRKYMYVDVMLDYLYNITYEGDMKFDETDSEEVSVYTANIPDFLVKQICGVDTLGLYQNIKNDNSDNEDIVSLMNTYIDSLDDSLTFSKGSVVFGINKDGVLCYMQLSAGGLGTRMYYTKYLVQNDSIEVRDLPDFSNSEEYIDNITSLADYISSFDSYEDAMNSLYSSGNEDLVTEVVESTEEVEETEFIEDIEFEGTESVIETEVSE